MYAMTGTLTAHPGQRDALVAILLHAAALVGALPACHLYLVCEQPDAPHAVQIVELWEDKAAHDASLQDERVRALISEAMPLLAGPPDGNELHVLGGHHGTP